MSLDDIDFAERYRQHMRCAAHQPKPAGAWDRRAREMSRKSLGGPYSEAFIERMDLTGARSLLDVGCGPGAICLPLAGRLEWVHGLDYSPAMLECLESNARELGLDNVQPILRAWEDDWSDVPVCDILVASRSALVADLDAILERINRHARLRVYMTQLVGGRFIDSEIASVLGRELPPAFPDYIYTINLLYRRGIHPRLDYIQTPSRLAGCERFEEFAEKIAWSFGSLSDDERVALQAWFRADPERARRGGAPMRWAFVSWDVPG
ncbi:Methyltransferase domain protein [compost metagenome]